MGKQIKVSIIIPVFNVERYLKQCLESVVNQTLNNIEIILVNDGSNDNSGIIARDYTSRYPFVKIIEQENCGQSVARNNGLAIANGKYIYFLDSDDYIEFNAMEDLYNEAELNNLDLVLFDGISFYDEDISNKRKYNFIYKRNVKYLDIMDGQDCFAKLIYNKDYFPSPCLLFIRKSVIDKQKIQFYESIIHEDELFTFKLMFQCNRVKSIDRIYFHRRIRKGSTMTDVNYFRSFEGYSTVFFEMLEINNKLEWKNEYIKDAMSIKMGEIFGGAINRYCYIKRKDRDKNLSTISKLKKTAKDMQYFRQRYYKLFYHNSEIYRLLRKLKDKINYMKMIIKNN